MTIFFVPPRKSDYTRKDIMDRNDDENRVLGIGAGYQRRHVTGDPIIDDNVISTDDNDTVYTWIGANGEVEQFPPGE